MSIFKTWSRESWRLGVPVSLSGLTCWRCNYTGPQRWWFSACLMLDKKNVLQVLSCFKFYDTSVCFSINVRDSGGLFIHKQVLRMWKFLCGTDSSASVLRGLCGFIKAVRTQGKNKTNRLAVAYFLPLLSFSGHRGRCAETTALNLALSVCGWGVGGCLAFLDCLSEIKATILNSFRKCSWGWVQVFLL